MQQQSGKSRRQGVVYDETRPDLLYHDQYGPNKDEETPLQRPRPPEHNLVVLRDKEETCETGMEKCFKKRFNHCWAVSLFSGLATLIGLSALILLFVMYFGKQDKVVPTFMSQTGSEHFNISQRLTFLEEENKKIKELYKSAQSQLSQVRRKRERTIGILSCTHSQLQERSSNLLDDIMAHCRWGINDIDEHFLSDESSKQDDLQMRKNRTLSPEFASRYKNMEDQFESHLSHQSRFCSQVRDSISISLYGRNTEKAQISESLTSANEKMLSVIASMELAASDEVYKEQDWINSQMKSARNLADKHQNFLQVYLTEKVLPQLRVIGSSILELKHVVQEVNSEIDILFNNQLDNWEKFILDQKELNSALFTFIKDAESSRMKHLQKLEEQESQSKERNHLLKIEFTKLISQVESFSQKMNHHVSRTNKTVDESMNIIGMIQRESSAMNESIGKYTETSIQSAKSVVYKGSQESNLIRQKQNYLLELMEKSFSVMNPASDVISSESQNFVSKFQDDSNKRYSQFEGELRKKSEKSSEYLKAFNENAQDVRSLTFNSQNQLESMLESHQGEDAKITHQLQKDIEGQCTALQTFGDSYGKKLRELGYSTNQMLLEELRQLGSDNPT